MLTTKSGGYLIFDITDPAFLPGRIPTLAFNKEAKDGFFFFQPSHWDDENHFGGFFMTQFTRFPIPYSTGFATEAEALEAAEGWETGAAERQTIDALNAQFMGIETFDLDEVHRHDG